MSASGSYRSTEPWHTESLHNVGKTGTDVSIVSIVHSLQISIASINIPSDALAAQDNNHDTGNMLRYYHETNREEREFWLTIIGPFQRQAMAIDSTLSSCTRHEDARHAYTEKRQNRTRAPSVQIKVQILVCRLLLSI
jgi:hypothetical protein